MRLAIHPRCYCCEDRLRHTLDAHGRCHDCTDNWCWRCGKCEQHCRCPDGFAREPQQAIKHGPWYVPPVKVGGR